MVAGVPHGLFFCWVRNDEVNNFGIVGEAKVVAIDSARVGRRLLATWALSEMC